ncbi:putative oxidoreductase [Bisgaardia hudsonensis]|uniref:Putative oxidoreductase n=1 Tax=Bisgaardia hudsonensis TaxID=109472 RepID=A0A4R2N1K6_9PAST|nr:DoxX family protein [Bisgaardia hudsonensis]QLB12985.1 hypothetical protein A6A11_04855 [Bisgaardia hudsonensis]TCP13452.1 putative oxidoreductase [Bisgaardia hudsonensis]
MEKLQNLIVVIGRFFLSAIFITSGFDKIAAYSGTQGYMESMGVPGMLLPLVITFEIFGGLAILLGFKVRLFALLMVGFNLLSAIIFHADFSNQIQMIMFMKNVSIAGGFLMLVAYGAGTYSIDAWLNKKLS